MNIDIQTKNKEINLDEIANSLQEMINFKSENIIDLELVSIKNIMKYISIYKVNIISYINSFLSDEKQLKRNISNKDLYQEVLNFINIKTWLNLSEEINNIYSEEVLEQKEYISNKIVELNLSKNNQRKYNTNDNSLEKLDNLFYSNQINLKYYKGVINFLNTTNEKLSIEKFMWLLELLNNNENKRWLYNFLYLLECSNSTFLTKIVNWVKSSKLVPLLIWINEWYFRRLLNNTDDKIDDIIKIFNYFEANYSLILINNFDIITLLSIINTDQIILISKKIKDIDFINLFKNLDKNKYKLMDLFHDYSIDEISNNIETLIITNEMPLSIK